MCRSPKSVVNEDIFRLQDGASALPTQEICGNKFLSYKIMNLLFETDSSSNLNLTPKSM